MQISSRVNIIKIKQSIALFIIFLALWPGFLVAEQTCSSGVTPTTPDIRFVNNGDSTVTDLYTGLMWQRCSIGQRDADCATGSASTFTWWGALQQVLDINSVGDLPDNMGYTDWRIPNISELLSLVEEACFNPAINLNVFPNTAFNLYYWSTSSSKHPSFSSMAWIVNIYDGFVDVNHRSYSGYYVRLVRGGS